MDDLYILCTKPPAVFYSNETIQRTLSSTISVPSSVDNNMHNMILPIYRVRDIIAIRGLLYHIGII